MVVKTSLSYIMPIRVTCPLKLSQTALLTIQSSPTALYQPHLALRCHRCPNGLTTIFFQAATRGVNHCRSRHCIWAIARYGRGNGRRNCTISYRATTE